MKKFRTKIVNEVRENCIRKAYVPQSIVKKYNVRIENGMLLIVGVKK